jgi:hypothetical protein
MENTVKPHPASPKGRRKKPCPGLAAYSSRKKSGQAEPLSKELQLPTAPILYKKIAAFKKLKAAISVGNGL